MKNTTRLLLSLLVFSSILCTQLFTQTESYFDDSYAVLKAIEPGYQEFRFFMTPEEVKQKITEGGYIAEGKSIKERVESIYAYAHVEQTFSYFDNYTKKYYAFHFHDDILALKAVRPKEIYHLNARYEKDFKVITSDAGLGKKNGSWQHDFVFYRYPGGDKPTYRLFGIALTYKGGDQVGEFNFLNNTFFDNLLKKFNRTYGAPHHSRRQKVDRYIYKQYYCVNQAYKRTQNPTYEFGLQVNITYVKFNHKVANFQITYLTSDYLKRYTVKHLHRREYYAALTDDEMLDF